MLIIGELINASRKSVALAITTENKAAIQKLARDQHENGAHYIDVNAGIFGDKEPDYLVWLVKTVQEAVDAPCCIDSPNPKAIEAAIEAHKGVPMINSISLEKARLDNLLPLLPGTGMKIVALCTSDEGMPKTADEREKLAGAIVEKLTAKNIAIDTIYVDPLVQAISTDSSYGAEFLNAIDKITTGFTGVHTVCGLSNISFGLPERKLLNQLFMAMAISRGLDGAIVNPLDQRMMANITAAEALTGKDRFCMNYLKAYRASKFDFNK